MPSLSEPPFDVEQYAPSNADWTFLESLPIGRILGPYCVGKSTCMSRAAALNPNFMIIGGFTSRDPRPGEQGKLFMGAGEIIELVKRGEVAHVIEHPTTPGLLMGSLVSEYPSSEGKYPLIDLSYTAVGKLPSTLPPIMIVTHHKLWNAWVAQRPDWRRLQDAKLCLEWGLDQTPDGLIWIENPLSTLPGTDAAQKIIDVVMNGGDASQTGRKCGEFLLRHVTGQLA